MDQIDTSASLIIQIGSQDEQSFALTQAITLVGREAMNDLVVNDAEVSRRHARIMRDREGHLIEDLGSTNGTFVNGQRVTGTMSLYHGDTIELGKSARLTYLGSATKPQPVIAQPMPEDTPGAALPPEEPPYESLFEQQSIAESEENLITPQIEPDEGPSGCQRFIIGCGCLSLLLLVLLIAGMLYADARYPDLLYCGPLASLWDTVLNPVLQLLGTQITCQ